MRAPPPDETHALIKETSQTPLLCRDAEKSAGCDPGGGPHQSVTVPEPVTDSQPPQQ